MSNFLTIITFSAIFFILGDVFGLAGVEVAYHKVIGLF
jgi:hypothetical protein